MSNANTTVLLMAHRSRLALTGRSGISWRVLAGARSRAAHRYSPSASYRRATGGIARYGEIGRPACDRRQLLTPAQAAGAPMTNPSLDSSGFAHPACV